MNIKRLMRTSLSLILLSGCLERPVIPEGDYGIIECRPNPFITSTIIIYEIGKFGDVTFDVLNLDREKIKGFRDSSVIKGENSHTWKPDNLDFGTYILRLKVDGVVKGNEYEVIRGQ